MKLKIFLLLAVCLLLLSGCIRALPEETQSLSTTTDVTVETTEPLPTEGSRETAPALETAPPPETEPALPEFYSTLDLRDFLRQCQESGIWEFSFRYTGHAGDVTAQNIARMGGYLYVEAVREGELCHVKVREYPGDRMVEAWRSGDNSLLSPEEVTALNTALSMVAQAKEASSDPLEQERLLFDLLRSHVTYHDGSTEITDPKNPPRYLTAVGALADGSANCQGYADGFYVLASLAGFRVSRMHVDIPEGGHTVNVIELDGAWYVVDATFNDLDDPSGVQVSYILLNVGREGCLRYSWGEEMERYPIPQHTDHHNYYLWPGTNRCFDSLQAMSLRVIDDYRAYGTTEFYLMLEGSITGWEELAQQLQQTAADYGLSLSFGIWYQQNVEDTYFRVVLE